MLVRDRMISPEKRLSADLPMASVIGVFDKINSSWLPVIDQEGTMLGLLTWADTRRAEKLIESGPQPSDHELLVRDFMTTKYLFVTENMPIEEAARIMIDYDISELPVVKDGYFAGIITDKIMLRVLMEITGARRQGIRLMVQLENKTGELLRLMQIISDHNGSVEGLCTYCGSENEYLNATMRVEGIDKYILKQALKGMDGKVIDIR